MRKISIAELVKVYYKLLNKTAYHCKDCMSANTDIMQISKAQKKGTFLELFSGSKDISGLALGYYDKVCSVDIEQKFNPTICSDILKLKLSLLPKDIDFIWASVPCTTYSVMSLMHHWERITYNFRQYYYYPKSKEAIKAVQILEKTLHIIDVIKPRHFIIENPRGALRHMPQMKSINFRHTVSYNDYGFEYYKPTDLFTNTPGLQLIKIKTCVNKNFAGSILSLDNAFNRSKVPGQLVHSILTQLR